MNDRILVIDFFEPHALLVRDAIVLGYGTDISNRIDIYPERRFSDENVIKGILYAKESGYSAVAYYHSGASNFVDISNKVYPLPVFMPAGSNGLNKVFKYSIPQAPIITGAGKYVNQTGYYIDFYCEDLISGGDIQVSSYSSYILGQILYIKETLNCTWWEARYRAMMTASENGVWHPINGFGRINIDAAINYTGTIAQEPFFLSSAKQRNNSLLIEWSAITNADKYKLYCKPSKRGKENLLVETSHKNYLDNSVLRSVKNYYYRIEAYQGQNLFSKSEWFEGVFLRLDELHIN